MSAGSAVSVYCNRWSLPCGPPAAASFFRHFQTAESTPEARWLPPHSQGAMAIQKVAESIKTFHATEKFCDRWSKPEPWRSKSKTPRPAQLSAARPAAAAVVPIRRGGLADTRPMIGAPAALCVWVDQLVRVVLKEDLVLPSPFPLCFALTPTRFGLRPSPKSSKSRCFLFLH